jgi:hypothetical protein
MPKKPPKGPVPAPKPRNPVLADLKVNPLYRAKKGDSALEKAEKRNPWNRDAKHKKKVLDEAYFQGIEITAENYVIEWVKRGRKNIAPLPEWEQAFQDAGVIDEAQKLGYIEIARNVACDISLTPKGMKLVTDYYEEHKKPKSLSEFYQVGDKVKVVNGALKKVLDRAEALRKKKLSKDGADPAKASKGTEEEGVVREPKGPAGTLGITIDGKYHIVDEDDVELIYEAFDYVELNEWSYAETTSGIRVPVSGEENEILNMCSNPVYKSNMDDREQEVARRMVSRGVLHRHKDDEGIYFIRDNKKLTRF